MENRGRDEKYFRVMLLNTMLFCSPRGYLATSGDIWQFRGTFLIVSIGVAGVGYKAEMLLNISQCTEQTHNKNYPKQNSGVPGLEKPGL